MQTYRFPIHLLPSTALLAAFIFTGCSASRPSADRGSIQEIPRADREFRAVWVATVDNIDWPSKPGLTTGEQQKEALAILDTAAALGLNAIVFQVRPHCDAMYASQIEPWSFYLNGTQGKAPDPYYDPLAFWIEEAHKRGLELHAWFNPYRAHMAKGGPITDSSIVRKKPGLAKELAGGTFWLDPAKQETQDHSFSVIMDVVHRYDVDGVHFDDYFYPYGNGNFPDDDTWAQYTKNGGSLSREDWRRAGVNTFIKRVYDGIKKDKPFVKFGISPFGIWRPTNPPSISGFDQYSGLYADARLWWNEGWVDYLSPQLYWPINQVPQSFPVLLGWWAKENTKERNLWPGMYTGRMNSEKGMDEAFNEIMVARGFVPEYPGHIHFSMKTFMKDTSYLNSGLKNGPYRRAALVPPSPWLNDHRPAVPYVETSVVNDTMHVTWSSDTTESVFRWVCYYQYNKSWEYSVFNKSDRSFALPMTRVVKEQPRGRRRDETPVERTDSLQRVAVTGVDRLGNESGPASRIIAPPTAQLLSQ